MTLVLVMAAALLLVPEGARAVACQPLAFETFDTTARPRAEIYRIGDTARIDVYVERRRTGEAISGATVFVGLDWGHEDRILVGEPRETGAAGTVTIKIPLRDEDLSAGPVTLMTYAYQTHLDTGFCDEVTEYGYEVRPRAFHIKS